MAMVDILITARDASRPAWASAERSVREYGEATSQSSVQADRLTTRIGFQQRQLGILEQQIRETSAAHGTDAIAVQRQQLAYDRLTASIAQNERTLERLHNEQRSGGPALPRTFAGFTGQGALQALGGLGVATSLDALIGQMGQLATEGQNVQATIDSTRASLAAQLGSMEQSNAVWSEGIAFAERYAITQEDLAEALRASAQIIRTGTSDTEDLLSVLGRLQSISPEQGLQGAALAVRELASGDTMSLVDRFELSRDAANEMKAEIQGGADAVAVLGRYLDSAGITNQVLESGLAGAAGETRAWAKAAEDLSLAIAEVGREAGVFGGLATLIGNTADEVRAIGEGITSVKATFDLVGQGILSGPFGTVIRFFDVLEDRLSGAWQHGVGVGWAGLTVPGQMSMARGAMSAAESAGRSAPTVNITVQGSVISDQQLTDTVHRGLLLKQQQGGDLGIGRK